MRFLNQLIKGKKGQALVEMALILPLLLLLFMGIFEFGRIFGAQLLISNLAREGARYGVVGHNDIEINNIILERHAWLDQNRMNVTIVPAFEERVRGGSLEVEIDYPLILMTPIIADILPNPLPLSANCLMRVE